MVMSNLNDFCCDCGKKFKEGELISGSSVDGYFHADCKTKPKPKPEKEPAQIRQFETGAIRDTDVGKLDYEGFLSPIVLQRYAIYLNKHRIQSDGQLRDSDNWQKGIPIAEYMKSKARHFMSTWLIHRGIELYDKGTLVDLEESLCAELFNTMGYLFEILKKKSEEK